MIPSSKPLPPKPIYTRPKSCLRQASPITQPAQLQNNYLLNRLISQGPYINVPSLPMPKQTRPLSVKIVERSRSIHMKHEISIQNESNDNNQQIKKYFFQKKPYSKLQSRPKSQNITSNSISIQNKSQNITFNLPKEATSMLEKMIGNKKNKNNNSYLPEIRENRSKSFLEPTQKDQALPKEIILPENYSKINSIDDFIFLIQEKKLSPSQFIYLIQRKIIDYYDLKVVAYSEIKEKSIDFFYTMSIRGVTSIYKGIPKDFVLLGDWLREREQYNSLKNLRFFKRFRKWKTLKKWFQLLKLDRNRSIANSLSVKLFSVQNIYQKILLKHRSFCCQIENMRFIDFGSTNEVWSLESFASIQQRKRKTVFDYLQLFSEQMHQNSKIGISIIMENIRNHIISDLSDDSDQLKLIHKIKPKPVNEQNLFDLMGLPNSLNYEHRSLLRNESLKVLRLAYLLDFITLESLASLYYNSAIEIKNKLKILENLKNHKEPLIQLNLRLNIENPHEIKIKEIEIDEYELESHIIDFDFNSMVEFDDISLFNQNFEIKLKNHTQNNFPKKRQPKNLSKFWLNILPNKEEIFHIFSETFAEGLEIIQSFKKWGKSLEFLPYINTLEEWDDPIGHKWVFSEENTYLDPSIYLKNGLFGDCEMHIDQIHCIIDQGFNKVESLKKELEPLLDLIWRDLNTDFNLIFEEKLARPGEILGFLIKFQRFSVEMFKETVKYSVDLGIFRVGCEEFKNYVTITGSKRLEDVIGWILEVYRRKNIRLRAFLQEGIKSLQGLVLKIEDFIKQRTLIDRLQQEIPLFRMEKDKLEGIFMLLNEEGLEINKEDRDFYIDLSHYETQLSNILQEIETTTTRNTEKFVVKIEEQMEKIGEEALEIYEELQDSKFLQISSDIQLILSELETYDQKTGRLSSQEEQLVGYAQFLQCKTSNNQSLIRLKEHLNAKRILWKSLDQWQELSENWKKQAFSQIDILNMEKETFNFGQIVVKCEYNLPANELLTNFKENIYDFKAFLPLAKALRSPFLKEEHWKAIFEKAFEGETVNLLDETFSFGEFIRLNLIKYSDFIIDISQSAEQEDFLDIQIKNEDKYWENKTLNLKNIKGDLLILTQIDEILIDIDEAQARMNSLLASKYIGKFRGKTEKILNFLSKFSEIIEQWTECQKRWIGLEKIFMANELKRELPSVFQMFETADKQLKSLLKRILLLPSVVRIVKSSSLLENFIKILDVFARLEKDLEGYLELKRQIFPRFYFLSNEELLEMLSEAQNISKIQFFLPKIFENVAKINMNQDLSISSILSLESEVFFINRPGLLIRGPLEIWLDQLLASLLNAVKKGIKISINDFFTTLNRNEWAEKTYAQMARVVSSITWCTATEASILEGNINEWYELNIKQINNTVIFLNDKTKNSLQKKLFFNLLIGDIHNRDVIQNLIEENVEEIRDFIWQRTLRFYWESEDNSENCVIKQLSQHFVYGYEYLGSTSRLIVTPLTEKCWLTITTALGYCLGTAPSGPAGTGKTETVKDLAKSLGVFCFVFNCSEQISWKLMYKVFTGLILTGVWTCLDEFNRIDIEVLSIIAQQLQTIRMALLNKLPEFDFEGKTLPLRRRTLGVFITMNPGYAGRTELPDNLKFLFRPISMISPNLELIVEVLLFANGFENACEFSKKIVKLYELCLETLTNQIHYDFGLRALKTMVLMAGEIHQEIKDEKSAIIKAINMSNKPKIIANDLEHFTKLLEMLFFETDDTPESFDPLKDQLKSTIEETCYLQLSDNFLEKILQLYYIIGNRHGIALIGPTISGKSQSLSILATTFSTSISVSYLNPKALSIGELYGETDQNTQDWHIGLIPTLFQTEKNTKENWIIFDGPIDSLWIENMNSVLDDNKILCLSNSERIYLKNNQKSIFEVDSLEQASPATVSRLGMIYFDLNNVGWKNLFKGWMLKKLMGFSNEDFNWNTEEIYSKMLEEIVFFVFENPVLKILDICEGIYKENSLNLLMENFCGVLESLLLKENGFKISENKEESKRKIEYLVCFAFIWGICVYFDLDGSNKIESILKEHFKSLLFPKSDSIFEYQLDPNTHSSFIVTSCPQPDSIIHFIPTQYTLNLNKITYFLLKSNKNPLFIGTKGSGKTHFIKQLFENNLFVNHNFSMIPSISPKTLQSFFLEHLQKRSINSKNIIFYIEDIHLSSQFNFELIRQIISQKGCYHRQKLNFIEINEIQLFLESEKISFSKLPSRFIRRFQVIQYLEANNNSIRSFVNIYIEERLKHGFPEEIKRKNEIISNFILDFISKIRKEFKLVGNRFYYNFGLRELKRFLSVLNTLKLGSGYNFNDFGKLIVNEIIREYRDPLLEEDLEKFDNILMENYQKTFNETLNFENLIYSNICNSRFLYEEIKDYHKFKIFIEENIQEYNQINVKHISIILFEEILKNLLKIIRILPSFNNLLIGISGMGRSSLTFLAAFILKIHIWQIEQSKGYNQENFKEDLIKLIIEKISNNLPVILFIKKPELLSKEIIVNIANLAEKFEIFQFSKEENEELINKVRDNLRKDGVGESIEEMSYHLKLKIRDNFHISLCINDKNTYMRTLFKDFPSFSRNFIKISFKDWDISALKTVGKAILAAEHHYSILNLSLSLHNSLKTFKREKNWLPALNSNHFISFISLFQRIFLSNQFSIETKLQRLNSGLSKLSSSQDLITILKQNLLKLEPELILQSQKSEEIAHKLASDKSQVHSKEVIAFQETSLFNEETKKLELLSQEAQNELSQALPALEEAENALKKLNKNDIAEIRTFVNPPPVVQLVMEAVCTLLEEKTDWLAAKSVLMDMEFLSRLANFNKNNIKENTLKKLRILVRKPEFDPEFVGQKSFACKSLSLWCRAMENYAKIIKIVNPKKAKCNETRQILEKKRAELTEKQKELQIIRSNISELEHEWDINMEIKRNTEKEILLLRTRLENASKLNYLLSDEKLRWAELEVQYLDSKEKMIGNSLLSAFFIEYLGVMTPLERQNVKTIIFELVQNENIPISKEFELIKELTSPIQIKKWLSEGLSNDSYSINSACMTIFSNDKWILLLDPHEIASKWVKNWAGIKILSYKNVNFLKILAIHITSGDIVILEDLLFEDEYSISALISKEITRDKGFSFIRLGDKTIEYNQNFKLFLHSKTQTPNLATDYFIKTRIINFSANFESLSEELLGFAMELENPEIQKLYMEILVEIAQKKGTLEICQEKILMFFSENQSSEILDDSVLIQTLELSKLQSAQIQEGLQKVAENQEKIEQNREKYSEIASFSANLFLTIDSLDKINYMYCFSLDSFRSLFSIGFKKGLINKCFIEEIGKSVFSGIIIGMFENDRRVLGFGIVLNILKNKRILNNNMFNIFKNDFKIEVSKEKNPDFIDKENWVEILKVLQLVLEEKDREVILKSFYFKENEWKNFKNQKQNWEFPGKSSLYTINTEILDIINIIFLKTLNPILLISEIDRILTKYGLIPLDLRLEKHILNRVNKEPIIIILSEGIDPTESLLKYCQENQKILNLISLGQGQGKKAYHLIEKAKESGNWILLQNCHLAHSWFPDLEKIIDSLSNENIHKDFRMIITTQIHPFFPKIMLKNSFKIALEPSQGLEKQINRLYSENEIIEPGKFKHLLMNLCIFHGILQERCRFVGSGFTIKYLFSDGDFDMAKLILNKFVCNENYEESDWEELNYLTSQICYGGRVTDEYDRNIVGLLLKKYYHQNNNKEYLDEKIDFSKNKELDILGISLNVEVEKNINENIYFFKNCEEIFTLNTIKDFEKNKEIENIINEINLIVKENIKIKENSQEILFKLLFEQELENYESIISIIKYDLNEINSIIKGNKDTNEFHEKVIESLILKKMPLHWTQEETQIELGDFLIYLEKRRKFLINWNRNEIQSFWLNGIFYKKRIFIYLMQNYSKKNKIPLEKITIKSKVLDEYQLNDNLAKNLNENTVFIQGLFLESADWDKKNDCLIEENFPQIYNEIPIIQINCEENYEISEDYYNCPLYKNHKRKGNYIRNIELKTKKLGPDFWKIRGTALLCNIK